MGFLVAESAAAPFLVLAGIFGFRPFPISGVQSGTPASFGFLGLYTIHGVPRAVLDCCSLYGPNDVILGEIYLLL
jgi:hypothetical protein